MTITPRSAAAGEVVAASREKTIAAVAAADAAITIRALLSGEAPSRCGIAIAMENAGGQTVSATVESVDCHRLDGTRRVPSCASDVAAPTYAMESGSKPGP